MRGSLSGRTVGFYTHLTPATRARLDFLRLRLVRDYSTQAPGVTDILERAIERLWEEVLENPKSTLWDLACHTYNKERNCFTGKRDWWKKRNRKSITA